MTWLTVNNQYQYRTQHCSWYIIIILQVGGREEKYKAQLSRSTWSMVLSIDNADLIDSMGTLTAGVHLTAPFAIVSFQERSFAFGQSAFYWIFWPSGQKYSKISNRPSHYINWGSMEHLNQLIVILLSLQLPSINIRQQREKGREEEDNNPSTFKWVYCSFLIIF